MTLYTKIKLKATHLSNVDKATGHVDITTKDITLTAVYTLDKLFICLPHKDDAGAGDVVLQAESNVVPYTALKTLIIDGLTTVNEVLVCDDTYLCIMAKDDVTSVISFNETNIDVDGIVYDYDTWEQQY